MCAEKEKTHPEGISISFGCVLILRKCRLQLEQQMGNRADDCQGNNGSFQENDEQFEQVNRQLGAENQPAHFVQKKHLGYGNHRNDEAKREVSSKYPGSGKPTPAPFCNRKTKIQKMYELKPDLGVLLPTSNAPFSFHK